MLIINGINNNNYNNTSVYDGITDTRTRPRAVIGTGKISYERLERARAAPRESRDNSYQ